MTKSKKLIPAANLLLRIINEESQNRICRLKDSELADLTECSISYVGKLLGILRSNNKIESKKIGKTGRKIRVKSN